MNNARLIIALTGIALPYLARIPYGSDWLAQYTDTSISGFLFFGAFNAIAWGALLGLSSLYQRPVSLIAPCLFGFGFLAWAHGSVDLGADPQAAIALVIIPVYALVPIAVGGGIGYVVDRSLRDDKLTG